MTYQEYIKRAAAIGMLPGPSEGSFIPDEINWAERWKYQDKGVPPSMPVEGPWHVKPGEEEKWAKVFGARQATWA